MIRTPNFQYDYPSVDIKTVSHAGGRKYENACGAILNMDTTTLNSNVNIILCSISNKT